MKVFVFNVTLIIHVLHFLLLGCVTAVVKLQPDRTCPLVIFIPFTDLRENSHPKVREVGEYGSGEWSSPEALGKASFSLMATAQMAKDHFNQRNPAVIPDLKNYESCDITFSDGWILDSAYSRSRAVDQFISITRHSEDPVHSICAVIGPVETHACQGIGVLTENLDIPQIAYETTDQRLSLMDDFPTFIRGLPSGHDFAATIPLFMQRDVWKRDFIGIIYDQTDFGEMFEDPIEDAESELGFLTIAEHIVQGDDDHYYEALGAAVRLGYRSFFLALGQPSALDDIAAVADELKLLGDGYIWAMPGEIFPPEQMESIRYEVGSPADKLLVGSALVTNYDPFVYKPEGDKFLEAWRSQGDEMLDRLRAVHPLSELNTAYYGGEPGYFQNETPTEFASYLYDAIVNAGMSACRSYESNTDHVEEIFNSDFQGASGRTVFKKNENGRDIVGVTFGLYNIRAGPVDQATNTRGYTRHLTAIYNGTEGRWTQIEGEAFVFSDGTTKEPETVRDTVDYNYLSPPIQLVGFIFVGFSLFISLLGGLWVFVRRRERIFTASQPQFLYLLCFGAILQAMSLFFFSFDESYGWTESQLDKACSAVPWFFVLGYLIQYCAIFSKLWRLSKLLSLRRRVVNVRQGLLPFAIIIGSSFVILLLWQLLDPLQWNRDLILPGPDDDNILTEDPWVSYGQCTSVKRGVLPYIIPLAFLFVVIMCMTLSISWKMREVQEDLSEAKWIFIGIFSHLQVWAIGIPVYLILQEVSRDAAYLISMALVVVFSNVFVVLVIGPKIVWDITGTAKSKDRKTPKISINGAQSRVSGIGGPGFPSQSLDRSNSHSHFSPSGHITDTYSVDRLKIMSLEAEVRELREALNGKDTEKATPESSSSEDSSGNQETGQKDAEKINHSGRFK